MSNSHKFLEFLPVSDRIERNDIKSGEAKNFTEVAWDGDKLNKRSQFYSGSSTAEGTITLT